jgi:hypothetical protein
MKLAFTSCVSAFTFTDQPVWDQIDASGATRLVLLGDSAYYDADGSNVGAVKDMGADQFAKHAYARLRKQCQQPQFRKLVTKDSLTTHAIWDDHDFLFNGACGAELAKQPTLAPLIPPSRAAFKAFRDALREKQPFPEPPDLWRDDVPAPGYECVDLRDGIWLHLPDGRSFKSAGGHDALLGAAQFTALAQRIEAITAKDPDAVHLLASGVVFDGSPDEMWTKCVDESTKLLALAASHRILMLSGDIHRNRVPPPRWRSKPEPGDKPLLEATASGAALREGVNVLELLCNWGLVDIRPDKIVVRLSSLQQPPLIKVIDRASWTMS